ncbi:MAG: hypothetical protein LBM72_01540 [Mycoplasmataceae bacterium]|jgi:hypothetical protein|nr:hypothetical protein [Mycoplasmataceae bacterium]
MEFVNKVELTGRISDIRISERGTNFVMIEQIVSFNGEERPRFFETLINADRKDLIDQLAKDKKVRVTGFLTIFKIKKFNIHKMLVEVQTLEVLG